MYEVKLIISAATASLSFLSQPIKISFRLLTQNSRSLISLSISLPLLLLPNKRSVFTAKMYILITIMKRQQISMKMVIESREYYGTVCKKAYFTLFSA
jgi:hypothetical protein